jgi:hypothetical protein
MASPEQVVEGRRFGEWQWDESFPVHLRAFSTTLKDLDDLQRSHIGQLFEDESEGTVQERSTVFLRSSALVLCAAWEAFVEDLLMAAIVALLDRTDQPSGMPIELQKMIVGRVKADKNELAALSLTSDGWKDVVLACARDRVANFHNPKSTSVKLLYKDMLGFDVVSFWSWTGKIAAGRTIDFDVNNSIEFVDGLVEVRGAIAHGRSPSPSGFGLSTFFILNVGMRLLKIAAIMHQATNERLRELCGVLPWVQVRFDPDWTPLANSSPEAAKGTMVIDFTKHPSQDQLDNAGGAARDSG